MSVRLIVCSVSLALASCALLLSQEKGGDTKAKAKGNGLIQPYADLEKSLQGKIERITVHGKSLEGNLEGDSADREVFVYLPPELHKETSRRFPVVYMLHGFGLRGQQWVGLANWGDRARSRGRDGEGDDPGESGCLLAAHGQFLLEFQDYGRLGDVHRRRTRELRVTATIATLTRIATAAESWGHSMGGYGTFPHRHEAPGSVFPAYVRDVGVLHSLTLRKSRPQWRRSKPSKRRRRLPRAAKEVRLRALRRGRPIPTRHRCSSDLPGEGWRNGVPRSRAAWAANSLMVDAATVGACWLKKYKAIAMNVGTQEPLLEAETALWTTP